MEDYVNVWKERLGQYTLQIVGLTLILPTILVITVASGLNPEAVTALLGSIIGYIFGSSRSGDGAILPRDPHQVPGPAIPRQPTGTESRKTKDETSNQAQAATP